jgi:predicted Zn-dependent protease
VVKDNTLNAFAAPGGHIFIFTGLINAIDEVDELAAVVTHEIGHVTARHISDRMEQNKKINMVTLAGMLAAVFLGGEAGGAVMTGAMAAGIQKQLQYSREDERQADQLGFKYMDEAGFDPAGMVRTLRKMQRSQYVGTDAVPAYLLTHPGGVERMANIDNMMKGYQVKADNPTRAHFRRQFDYFKTIVLAKYGNPREAERLFEEMLKGLSDSALAHLGLGMLMIGDAEYGRAVEHFKKANAVEPDSGIILRSLGEAYQYQGRDRDAVAVLKRATQIDRNDRSAFYLLAVSYQNLGDYERAISLYERLRSPVPVKNEVFYNLGVCYGRLSHLGPAHYYFGIYFKRLGQREKAEFHFQKAESLSRQDPALLEKIQKAKTWEEERFER